MSVSSFHNVRRLCDGFQDLFQWLAILDSQLTQLRVDAPGTMGILLGSRGLVTHYEHNYLSSIR